MQSVGAARRGRSGARRGAVLVLIAGGLLCFSLLLGLVIDVGFWYTRKAQVQLNADMALMAAMGKVDQSTLDAAAQQTFITDTVKGIVQANGYDPSLWTFTFTQETVAGKTIVSKAVVNTTQQLPRFFTAVIGAGTLPMATRSTAEKKLIPGLTSACAIIALDNIIMNGGGNGQVDSFLGDRVPSGTFESKSFDNANANLCSNANIDFGGNNAVFGDMTTGGSLVVSGVSYTAVGDFITGGTSSSPPDTGVQLQNQNLPTFTFPVPVPPANIATTNNDNASITGSCGLPNAAGVWTCAGSREAHLTAGNKYYFSDHRFTGQARIIIDGTPASTLTEIWMNGNMALAGGMSFAASGVADGNLGGVTASNLRINGIGGAGSTIVITGGTEMVADIVAPGMDVTLSGSSTNFFGRVIANDLTLNGGVKFSYDESIPMTEFVGPSSSIRVHLTE